MIQVQLGVAFLTASLGLAGCSAPTVRRTGPSPAPAGEAIRVEAPAPVISTGPAASIRIRLWRSPEAPLLPPTRYLSPCPVAFSEPLLSLKVQVFGANGKVVEPSRGGGTKLAPPHPSEFRADGCVEVVWKVSDRYDMHPGQYTLEFWYDYRANYPGLKPFYAWSRRVTTALRVDDSPSPVVLRGRPRFGLPGRWPLAYARFGTGRRSPLPCLISHHA